MTETQRQHVIRLMTSALREFGHLPARDVGLAWFAMCDRRTGPAQTQLDRYVAGLNDSQRSRIITDALRAMVSARTGQRH